MALTNTRLAPAVILAEAIRCKGLNAEIVASVTTRSEAISTPSWMKFTLTDELIDEILYLRHLCISNDLYRAEAHNRAPEYGTPPAPEDEDEGTIDEIRTGGDVLRIYDSMFCFAAIEHYSDDEIESSTFYFDSFFTDVADGRRFFGQGEDDDELRDAFTEDQERAHA